MGALEQWHRELAEGKRTTLDLDALWDAACGEAADRAFEAYVRPVRERVAALRTPPAPAPRARKRQLTKWKYTLEIAEAE